MSLYKVVVGVAGTVLADGRAAYHKAGELVDLTEAEAERLLHLKAVEQVVPEDPKPAAKTAKAKD